MSASGSTRPLSGRRSDGSAAEATYQQLLARFDQLWESASSPRQQREMQELLILINQHEAARQAVRTSCNTGRCAQNGAA